MRVTGLVPILVTAAFLAGCSGTSTPPASQPATAANLSPSVERKYLLERVDDAAVVQLYADGFQALPLRE